MTFFFVFFTFLSKNVTKVCDDFFGLNMYCRCAVCAPHPQYHKSWPRHCRVKESEVKVARKSSITSRAMLMDLSRKFAKISLCTIRRNAFEGALTSEFTSGIDGIWTGVPNNSFTVDLTAARVSYSVWIFRDLPREQRRCSCDRPLLILKIIW